MPPRPNRRQALRALLASTLATAAGAAGAQPLPAVREPLNVLFFNTHLLPAAAQSIAGRRGQDDYRVAAIAGRLHSYDLVGLCEVFEARRRRQIIEIVGENSYQAYRAIEPPESWGRHLTGSGLLLLTRLPIDGEPHFITYRAASRVITHGVRADGLAAKGALHVRLRVGEASDMLADCFLTHLESICPTARAAQIDELAAFIAAHAAIQRPLMLLGDLNVEADFPAPAPGAPPSEYARLLSALRFGDAPLVDLWTTQHAGRGGTRDALARQECPRIDYVFLSPPHVQNRVHWQPLAMQVEPFLDPRVKQGSLSDHAGLTCRLALPASP